METFPNTQQATNAFRASGAEIVVLHTRWLKAREDQEAMLWLRAQANYRFEGEFSDHAEPVAVFRRVPTNGEPVAKKSR